MVTYNSDLLKQYIRRIGLDLLIIPLTFYLSWLIRFDGHVPAEEWGTLIRWALPIVCVYIIINLTSGIYRRLWAYASFRDVVLLSETVGLGTLIVVVVNFALTSYYDYRLPTGGLIIGGLLTLALSTVAKYRRQLQAIFFAPWDRANGSNPERVLIIGINETAQQLATQIYLGKSKVGYELVGLIDGPNGKGMNFNGVEILGPPDQIPTLVRDKQIDVIIIARRPSNREEMWRLISTCRETTAQVKVLPDIGEVIEGCYEDPLTLRDVSMDDILGRAPATADVESCKRILADKVVLVTGAAGSIGSELCRQVLRFEPRLLLALDNNETGLYELNLELNQDGRFPLQLIMGDVADWHKMDEVFQQYRPQIILHAAAYKHVPLVESHPDEALRVNIMGTVIVSEAAHEYKAERFVFISTDKAVKPSSTMGASKRVGELWMEAMAKRNGTIFTAVRFGNVIGSRGSVLPTFARQIELGGPVTVTHPEMHRFFISIPEAVSLVLESAAFSQSGEVFMLDMGEEISILDLAQRMIRLRGLRVHKDVEIEFVGIRPGEKLHEELVYGYEVREETPHPRIHSLQSPDEPIDHDTLLGVILILAHSMRLPREAQRVQEGIFQIASRDVDGFLNEVTGLDLTRDWRQVTSRVTIEAQAEEKVVRSTRVSRIAERAGSAPRIYARVSCDASTRSLTNPR